jgi:hypothetical protein
MVLYPYEYVYDAQTHERTEGLGVTDPVGIRRPLDLGHALSARLPARHCRLNDVLSLQCDDSALYIED